MKTMRFNKKISTINILFLLTGEFFLHNSISLSKKTPVNKNNKCNLGIYRHTYLNNC